MGTYFNFKTSFPDKVNVLFALAHKDEKTVGSKQIVTSVPSIMEDLAYFQHDPKQAALKHIASIEQYNEGFPALSLGRGQVKLNNVDEWGMKIIRWVLNNQDLFDEINDQSGDYIPKEPEEFQIKWSLVWDNDCDLSDDDMGFISDEVERGCIQGIFNKTKEG
jgi:hypothetical protein